MKIKRLGVNIDHVATVRNARGESYPSPLKAALIAQKSGADSITIHLREDRRHINDNDLRIIKKKIRLPINLEMAPTNEMLKIAKRFQPDFVCIVPEKRSELTTEGGLNLKKNKKFLFKIVNELKKFNIRISLFIEPNVNDIKISHILGVDCVELHTGKFCNLFNNGKETLSTYFKIEKCAKLAKNLGLEVHAGHGLTYKSTKKISKISDISEFNIGNFIISEAIFLVLKNVIKKFKKILNK